MHSFKPNHGKTIDLFFCYHQKCDFAALKEFEGMINSLKGIRIFSFCSEEKKRLNASEIVNKCPDFKNRKIFMCGPKKLTNDLKKQLIGFSVKKQQIEYEDFNFF